MSSPPLDPSLPTPTANPPPASSGNSPLTPGLSSTSIAPLTSATSATLTIGTTIRLTEKTLSLSSWPKDLTLNINKSNWRLWSLHAELLANRQGFTAYLDGTLLRPDDPEAAWIWTQNDKALQGFILAYVSPSDLTLVRGLPSSHAMYEALRKRHEKRGPFAQLLLLKKFLDIRFESGIPFERTINELKDLHTRISDMGPVDGDKLLIFGFLHALGSRYVHLQSAIQRESNSPGFDSLTVEALIEAEQNLAHNHDPPSHHIALAANPTRLPRTPCGTCNRLNHSTDFCISPGGKLAGKTIEEARTLQAAHRLAHPRPRPTRDPLIPSPQHALVANQPSPNVQTITVNGAQYTLITPSPAPSPSPSPTPSLPSNDPSWPSDNTAYISVQPNDDPSWLSGSPTYSPTTTPNPSVSFQHRAYLAHANFPSSASIMEVAGYDPPTPHSLSPHYVSFDWSAPSPAAFAATPICALESGMSFIFDSGASCHISPVRSDFKTFRSISSVPVTGLGGSAVYAVGCGSVEIIMAAGLKLTLHDVLYIPSSDVRLVSVHSLNAAGRYTSHFDSDSCWVTDLSGSVIARGLVLPQRNLYVFPSLSMTPPGSVPSSVSVSAHVAQRVPTVETWHRRLGHCNHRTIVDMARTKVVEGMHINLSYSPPKCNACILGKQTRSSVPKVREGIRALRPLERVFLDLCGPMFVTSRTGRRYSMNIVDDYSNFVWSLPLRTKDEALIVLRDWLAAVENQSGFRLTYLITDNGELASNSMSSFCSQRGITHLFTAPYTSAHNGRAERLHRTLSDKTRAMRLACKAPPSMWDEFCATAAFLTNLTSSSALNGKTPYELWYRRIPCISHLREIGCRAYALIHSHNPKLLPRSVPCIMIGYGTRSKAYRLWDPSSNRIFDSFHVSFIEHLDAEPTPLHPNTVLGSDTADAPGSWNFHSHTPPSAYPRPHSPSSNPPTPDSPPSLPFTHFVPYSVPPLPLPPSPTPPLNRLHTVHTPALRNSNPLSDPVYQRNLTNTITHQHNTNTVNQQHSTNTVNQQHNTDTVNQKHNTNTVNQQHDTNTVFQQLPINTANHHHNISTDSNLQRSAPLDNAHYDTASLDRSYTDADNASRQPHTSQIPPSPPSLSSPHESLPHPPLTITIPPVPPPRRSSRIPISSNRTLTNDGLLPSSRLHAIKQDIAASTAHRLPSVNPPTVSLAQAFLAEYSPVRESHDLFPLSLSPSIYAYSVDHALLSLSDGTVVPAPESDSDDDPLWSKALASPEREYWIAGARDEIRSLEDLRVFVLVPRSAVPRGQRPLQGKLVCKRKRDDSGNVIRYKVRYVAKGYTQRYGVDYDKTTAPTARLESFRSILHIGASLDWDIQQYDIKTAFLHGVLPDTETMFMEQPPGFESPGKETWVMRLMKSIYGMKQASRVWNRTFDAAVRQWGFLRVPCEWCVYHRTTPQGTVIFAVHVDDIISIASTAEANNNFKVQLNETWKISDLGEAKFALGIAITRDRSKRTIGLSQTALIDRVTTEFGQTNSHHVDTPMIAGLQLTRPDKNMPVPASTTSWMEKTPYRALIGSLNYIAVGTRPDIAYAVGRLASFLDCYRPEHWEAAVRVVRYLKGTRLLSLQLGGLAPITLLGHSDSDYANCPDTSRSIGGYCFSLGGGAISWASRKQKTVADSSCYAEYIALHEASHEVVFLRELLANLTSAPPPPTIIYCDNDAASILTEDHVWHARVKHIRVKYHYIRELVTNKEVLVQRVRSLDNTADILTKPLNRSDFTRLRHYLGLRFPPDADAAT